MTQDYVFISWNLLQINHLSLSEVLLNSCFIKHCLFGSTVCELDKVIKNLGKM